MDRGVWGGLQSMGSQRTGHDWATDHIYIYIYREREREREKERELAKSSFWVIRKMLWKNPNELLGPYISYIHIYIYHTYISYTYMMHIYIYIYTYMVYICIYIYMYIWFFSITDHYRYWAEFPMLDSRALLFIYLIYSTVYLLGEGNGIPLQYSFLGNPMDRGAWWAAVHGVLKSRTRLSDFTFTLRFHALEKEMTTHSSVLAWRIPCTEEPHRLQSMGSLRVRHDWWTSLSRTGEGNGHPLQCSCLENPRDGGAWWAAVYGVPQSPAQLKWLSSSSLGVCWPQTANLSLPRFLPW